VGKQLVTGAAPVGGAGGHLRYAIGEGLFQLFQAKVRGRSHILFSRTAHTHHGAGGSRRKGLPVPPKILVNFVISKFRHGGGLEGGGGRRLTVCPDPQKRDFRCHFSSRGWMAGRNTAGVRKKTLGRVRSRGITGGPYGGPGKTKTQRRFEVKGAGRPPRGGLGDSEAFAKNIFRAGGKKKTQFELVRAAGLRGSENKRGTLPGGSLVVRATKDSA